MRVPFLVLALALGAPSGALALGVHGPAPVLTGAQAAALLRPCSRRGPGRVDGPWTPGPRDLARLEAALPAFHARLRATATDPRFDRPLGAYARQYAGFVANGRRVVYVNLWIGTPDPRWQREAAVVCDGGPTNWGVEFDVATGRFLNPAFNGR